MKLKNNKTKVFEKRFKSKLIQKASKGGAKAGKGGSSCPRIGGGPSKCKKR